MTNKELPSPVRAKPSLSVQDTVSRAVQKEAEEKQRHVATGFLDRFLSLFSDYSHHSGRTHKRMGGAASTRSSDEIMAELHAFQNRMPRPWRYAGNQPKPVHAIRFRYRRALDR